MNYRSSTVALAVLAAMAMTFTAAPSSRAQQVTKTEQKCSQTLGKATRKYASTNAKANASCRQADVSGKVTGACPDVKGAAKIQKAADKLAAASAKSCASTCSLSTDIACVSDSLCPPLPNAQNPGAQELCSGNFKVFDMGALDFPGALCPGLLGSDITQSANIGECAALAAAVGAGNLTAATYGSLASSSLQGNKDALKCLGTISKSTRKLSDTIFNGVISCTAAIQSGKVLGNKDTCKDDDPKVAAKIQKAADKLDAGVRKSCTDSLIQVLDVCNAGVGGTTTVDDAVSCLTEAAFEITDSSDAPALRQYSPIALTEASYPPGSGVCGDGVINQLPNPFFLLGEECDLDDDAACPGACFPPGDVWECTCPSNRNRVFSDGITADLDSGWTGTSHNQGVADGAGFIYTLENCDCDAFTGATCTGSSSDSVCDVAANTAPFCSWDPFSTTQCDANSSTPNNVNEDKDCAICDAFSANAGSYCRPATVAQDCQAQCYDQADLSTPVGNCTQQSDCGAGEVCLGACDRTPTCVITPNGSNLPISSGGTAVCIKSTFRDNVSGTLDIVSGDIAYNQYLYSQVHLGVASYTPCPVCGGFCEGGPSPGKPCEGSCSVNTAESCRFDDDCPDFATGEECLSVSPECGSGGTCNLSLVCYGGANNGAGCRVEAATRLFGTTSSDCPPDPAQNISGTGLRINFEPMTTGTVALALRGCFNGSAYSDNCDTNADCSLGATCEIRPCTADGSTNFDCPCPDGKSTNANAVTTKPNRCAAACDAGVNYGKACNQFGANIFGTTTKCSTTQCLTGANKGLACASDADCGGIPGYCQNLSCDSDADCPGGGTCDVNPLQCSGGDPADEGTSCTTNGDCATGTCGDACPGGRCVPLCLPATDPTFSARCAAAPYIECTTNGDCPVGDSCAPYTDSEEGFCAGGDPNYHCSGASDTFRGCFVNNAEGSCSGVCTTSCSASGTPSGGSLTPCESRDECGGGEICCGACELSQYCEAGIDAIIGTADDNIGAGRCFADERNCFVPDGDLLGQASGVPNPSNPSSNTIYCVPPTANNSINAVAGLGGPGRLRQNAENIPQYNALPFVP